MSSVFLLLWKLYNIKFTVHFLFIIFNNKNISLKVERNFCNSDESWNRFKNIRADSKK